MIKSTVQEGVSAGKRSKLREADYMPDAIAGKRTKLREARLNKGCRRREENKLREARLLCDKYLTLFYAVARTLYNWYI
jgi:hypothetical protein